MSTHPRKKRRGDFHPTVFKLLATEDKLTAAAGLATIMEVFDDSPLSAGFKAALPTRSMTNGRSGGSYRLGLIQLNSFIYGHDSLDDLEEFREDPLLEEAMQGKVVAPKTIGDWLRDWSPENHQKMNIYLRDMSRWIRKMFIQVLPQEHKPREAMIIDIDSTDHEQTGSKIEGCAWNYKGHWGLYSEVAYDELGLCHGVELAPGNTKPGSTCVPMIERCFSGLKFNDEKYFRADSAYCWQDPIATLVRLGVTYVIAANDATTDWRSHIGEVEHWEPWAYSQEELEKAQERGKQLPTVELGRFYWRPSWSDSLRVPVVVKRTWKEAGTKTEEKDGQMILLSVPAHWTYFAVIANFNLLHNTLQSVMEFYQKRGNAERFIREEKYGFDLLHMPCLAMNANSGFLQLAMVAHNLLRWIAIVQKPDKPHFSKKIRRRYVYIPGKVILHARQVFLKIPVRFYEEVRRLKEALQLKPGAPMPSSAFASGFA